MAIKIGELLVKAKVITEQQLKQALDEQKRWGGRLGEILVRMTFVSEDMMVKALSKQLNIARVDLDALPPVPKPVLGRIPHDVARDLQAIALQLKEDKSLVVAMVDPTNLIHQDTLAKVSRCRIVPVIAGASQIARMIARCYTDEESEGEGKDDTGIKFVDSAGKTLVRNLADLQARGEMMAARPKGQQPPPPVAAPPPPPPVAAPPPAASAGNPAAVLASVEDAQRRELAALKAMVELLIEKGVFTREEYFARVRR
jgi:hypothetical protein